MKLMATVLFLTYGRYALPRVSFFIKYEKTSVSKRTVSIGVTYAPRLEYISSRNKSISSTSGHPPTKTLGFLSGSTPCASASCSIVRPRWKSFSPIRSSSIISIFRISIASTFPLFGFIVAVPIMRTGLRKASRISCSCRVVNVQTIDCPTDGCIRHLWSCDLKSAISSTPSTVSERVVGALIRSITRSLTRLSNIARMVGLPLLGTIHSIFTRFLFNISPISRRLSSRPASKFSFLRDFLEPRIFTAIAT